MVMNKLKKYELRMPSPPGIATVHRARRIAAAVVRGSDQGKLSAALRMRDPASGVGVDSPALHCSARRGGLNLQLAAGTLTKTPGIVFPFSRQNSAGGGLKIKKSASLVVFSNPTQMGVLKCIGKFQSIAQDPVHARMAK